ncbi:MAG: carbohydrate binding family 9 domain-containing protein [Gemmatimonadetes bacterium]|nr:carbohydrate binding family 9 domain-containing protein [Gemmatimonadota bacterium]
MALALVTFMAVAASASAQGTPISGPPAPVAPAVINRDSVGQATIRAIKLSAPLKLDGVLDEPVYAQEKPFGGLIQVAPDYGKPASERSDIWITYDDTHIYLSCKCYDESDPSEWIVNELRRDTGGLRNNEHIGMLFDTFYDRRSGYAFYTNPLGARADYSIVDEGGSNTDWNPVWTSKSGRFEGGWTVEMAIPFKSLRYRAGKDQVWGIQIRRSIRHKNEWAYLTPVPRIMSGPQALNRVSAAGTLVGLDLPAAGKNIELKPYGVSRSTTDNTKTPKISNAVTTDIGGDIKYAITPNLTADVTVNTDFAQVEIDEQQVNLTRFSLFFPEKREFFLEGRGIFEFGRGGGGAFGFGGGGGGGGFGGGSDTPSLFYTRRIGLNNGAVIPINAGGRVTGKVGKWAIGAMGIGTADDAASATKATNFSVLRVKRDILSRSSVGFLATNRSVATSGKGTNSALGADATFLLSQELSAGGYWAQTSTTGITGDNQSYQGRVDYSADKYGARAEFLSVGKNFDPQVGFRRRGDFDRSFAELRFSPRPRNMPNVRKFTFTGSGEYFENGTGVVESRVYEGNFSTEFASSDMFTVQASNNYEFLTAAFTPSGSSAPIATGGYTFSDAQVSYTFGAQRRASGSVRVHLGEYYDGTIKSMTIGQANPFSPSRMSINQRLAIEPSFTITSIERKAGSFRTRIARTRIDYGFSPLMFASALLQYSSADRAFGTNLRFRWEYAPGSEIFLVYTDERDTTDDRFATPTTVRGQKNRAIVLKVNRLFRY